MSWPSPSFFGPIRSSMKWWPIVPFPSTLCQEVPPWNLTWERSGLNHKLYLVADLFKYIWHSLPKNLYIYCTVIMRRRKHEAATGAPYSCCFYGGWMKNSNQHQGLSQASTSRCLVLLALAAWSYRGGWWPPVWGWYTWGCDATQFGFAVGLAFLAVEGDHHRRYSLMKTSVM